MKNGSARHCDACDAVLCRSRGGRQLPFGAVAKREHVFRNRDTSTGDPAVAFRIDEPPCSPCTHFSVLERHKTEAEAAGGLRVA